MSCNDYIYPGVGVDVSSDDFVNPLVDAENNLGASSSKILASLFFLDASQKILVFTLRVLYVRPTVLSL